MSNTLRPYLNTIRSTLSAAMSVRNLPCLQVERHNRPEVEYKCVRRSALRCMRRGAARAPRCARWTHTTAREGARAGKGRRGRVQEPREGVG